MGKSREQMKAIFAQKRSGLNRVTVQRLSQVNDPEPVFQVNVNGKGAFFPSNVAQTKLNLKSAIESAVSADEQNRKINQ